MKQADLEEAGLAGIVNIQTTRVLQALRPRGFCLAAGRGRFANRRAAVGEIHSLTVRAYFLHLSLPGGGFSPVELVAPRDEHPDGMPEIGSPALPWGWFNNLGQDDYLRTQPGDAVLLSADQYDLAQHMQDNALFRWAFRASRVTIHRKPDTPAIATLILVRRL